MPRARDPERADFMAWVTRVRSVRTRSAETYARRAWTLRSMTPDARPGFIAGLSPSMRGDYVTAWRIYRAWRKSKEDAVPAIVLPRVPRCPYPRDIMKSIYTVLQTASGLSALGLAQVRWSDVRREGLAGRWTIYHAGKAYPASAAHLGALEAWGRPEGAHAPVVPEQPGGLTPVNAYNLTTWIKNHRAAKPTGRRAARSTKT